jgi:cobalt-zinc-cadmium efflux system membrane fusion protein
MKTIKIIFILLCAGLYSCGTKNSGITDEHAVNEEHKENTGTVVLTGEQVNIAGIKLGALESRNISGYIKASGEVKINPDQESRVGGIIPGRIKRINSKEGSFVRAGQVLATIENLDLVNVQTDYVEALHEYEHSKREYERQQALRRDNIGSEKELAKLRADYEHALVSLRASEQKLESYRISKSRFSDTSINVQRYFSITAPISGKLVSRMITVGQYVDPSVDMFYIVNTSTVYVDINVFEQDLGKINAGQRVAIESGTYPGEVFEGKISSINNVFDDASRTVKVRVLIDNNAGRLLPNMFITAKIYIKEGSVLAVPKSAVEEEGEQKFIYVKTGEKTKSQNENHKEHSHKDGEEHEHSHEHDGENHEEELHAEGFTFKRVAVRTGIEDEQYIEVIPLEDITGSEIVYEGIFYLKSEMQKEELGTHQH